ncbi:MAG: hypothetical protein MHM6MM_006736 [Cercozoa sp. M6MM]
MEFFRTPPPERAHSRALAVSTGDKDSARRRLFEENDREMDRVLTTRTPLRMSHAPSRMSGRVTDATMASILAVYEQDRQEQMRINRANSQLHALSLFSNYANALRAARLQQAHEVIREDMRRGEAKLHSLQNTVGDLESENERQREAVRGLSESLEQERTETRRRLAQYDAELEQTQQTLRDQQMRLDRMLALRFRVDGGVDAALCVAALLLVRSWPFRLSSRMVAVLVSRVLQPSLCAEAFAKLPSDMVSAQRLMAEARKRRGLVRLRKWRRRHARLALFVFFLTTVTLLRKTCASHGLHSGTGSFRGYLRAAVASLRPRVQALLDRNDTTRTWSHRVTTWLSDEDGVDTESCSDRADGTSGDHADDSNDAGLTRFTRQLDRVGGALASLAHLSVASATASLGTLASGALASAVHEY